MQVLRAHMIMNSMNCFYRILLPKCMKDYKMINSISKALQVLEDLVSLRLALWNEFLDIDSTSIN